MSRIDPIAGSTRWISIDGITVSSGVKRIVTVCAVEMSPLVRLYAVPLGWRSLMGVLVIFTDSRPL